MEEVIVELRKLKVRYDDLVDAWRGFEERLESIDPLFAAKYLMKDDVWWSPIVAHILLQEASTQERFVDFVVGLLREGVADPGRPPLSEIFFELASSDSSLAKSLAQILEKVETSGSEGIIAMLVAGVSRSDFGWAHSKAEVMISSKKPDERASGYRALCRMLADDSTERETIAGLVLASPIPEDPESQVAYTECLSKTFITNPRESERKMLDILERGGESAKWATLRNIAKMSDVKADVKKHALQIALESEERHIRETSGPILVSLIDEDSEYVMATIVRMAEHDLLGKSLGIYEYHVLHSIGKANRVESFTFIDDYAKEYSHSLLLQMPEVLVGIFQEDLINLIKKLGNWDEPCSQKFDIRLRVLKRIISRGLRKRSQVEDYCVKEVFSIARQMKIDVDKVSKGDRDPDFRALRVIETLLHPIKKVNYEQLMKNLDAIPHVRDFFDHSWFRGLQKENAQTNLIPHMFDHIPPDNKEISEALKRLMAETDPARKWSYRMIVRQKISSLHAFEYWDDIFTRLDLEMPGVRKLRRNIKTGDEPENYLCEAEIISLFLKKYIVEIEPAVSEVKGNPDLRVHFSNQSVILEVYNPRPPRVLEFANGAHGLDIHRLKKKILEKYERQLKASEGVEVDPVVIVLNTERSTFTEWDVMNTFFGTEALQMLFDKEEGRAIDTKAIRKADSITHVEPGTSIVSGVLFYQHEFCGYSLPVLIVSYYPNPGAANPLTPRTLEEMCRVLSSVWVPESNEPNESI